MILIMLSHATNSFDYGRLFTPLGGIGVAVFLIVSGYGINESIKRSGFKNYWVKRIIKVWMPYVLAVFTVLAMTGKVNSFSYCMKSILFIERPYWFIPYIFQCYLAYWVIYRHFHQSRGLIWVILIILSIIFLPEIQAEQSFSFYLGVLLSEKGVKIKEQIREKEKLLPFIVIVLLSIGVLFLGIKQTPYVRSLQDSVYFVFVQILIKGAPALAIILLPYALKSHIVYNRTLNAIGIISYELYLVHFPLFDLIKNSYLNLMIFGLMSFVCSYALYKINIVYSNRLLRKFTK